MPGQDAKIVLSAEDRTRAAFESAKKGLGGVGAAALSAKSALATLGLGVVGAAFVANVRSAANYADEMGKLAARAGTASTEYSKLAYAAGLADVSNQELSKGLVELSKDIGDGGKRLAELGIGLKDSAGKAKTSDQIFREVADRFSTMPDGVDKTSAAVKLFGDRVGPQLITLLNAGSAGLREMGNEAERFGRVVEDDAAKQAEAFNDNMTRLATLAQSAGYNIANSLIPSVARLSNEFLTGLRNANGLLDAMFTFGTIGTFEKPADGAKKYRNELGRLRAERDKLIDAEGVTANTSGFDREIETAKKRLAYFNDLQRQGINIDPNDQSGAEGRRLGLRPPTVVPEDPNKKNKKSGGLTDAQKAAAQQEKDYQSLLSSYSDAEDKHRWDMYSKQLDDQAKAEQAYADLMKRMDADTDAYRQAKFAERLEAEGRAIADAIKAQADAQKEQAKRLGDAFSSTFDRAFTDGMKLGDLIKKLAFDAINIQFLTPATQKLGAGLGSVVSKLFSFDGGGYTGSGSRSGGVDGKGGFPALLHPNESVIDHTRGGSGAGGGVTYISNNNYDFRGADQSAVPRLQAMAENIKRAAVAEVFAKVNRGGSAATNVGRSR